MLRFLWLTGRPDAKNTTLRVLRMTRVVFGVSSSPFLLAATIRNHLEKYQTSHPQVINTLKDSLYVDDFIASSSSCQLKLFDPMGFLTPFTMRVKCLFQDMWQRGISWDEKLPDDLSQKWQQWCTELLQLHQIVIPRWYGTETLQFQVLHVFSDASKKAYGAAAYLQGQTAEGESMTSPSPELHPLRSSHCHALN